MINELSTIILVANTIMLACLVLVFVKIKRNLPDFQQIFDDLGGSIGEQFQILFEKPSVSKAMSVLGKASGDKRADAALRKKAAESVIGQYPAAGFVLKQMGMTPLEGIKLINDPMIGPMIQKFMANGAKGLSKMGQSQNRQSVLSSNNFEVK